MVFVNSGITQVVTWLRGSSATAPTHIGVGIDSTAPDEEDTTLIDEKGRYTLTATEYGDEWVKFTVLVVSTALNGNTLKEFGLFNASSSGTMFTRSTNSSIVKTSSLEVQYEITIQVTN